MSALLLFFGTPLGRYTLFGVGALAAIAAVWLHGYNRMRVQCNLRAAEYQARIVERDQKIGQLLQNMAASAAEHLQRQQKMDDEYAEKLRVELEKLPEGDVCRATLRDLQRLR